MNTISKLSTASPIINPETGRMLEVFSAFVLQVQLRGLIIGTGSPENVVDGRQGQEYMDETGVIGAVKYIKQLTDIGGDSKRGWVAIG